MKTLQKLLAVHIWDISVLMLHDKLLIKVCIITSEQNLQLPQKRFCAGLVCRRVERR